jgi:hypothetical protein
MQNAPRKTRPTYTIRQDGLLVLLAAVSRVFGGGCDRRFAELELATEGRSLGKHELQPGTG